MDWNGFDWAAVPAEEIGGGCDDAAFFGLEEISGDAYQAETVGLSKVKKKRKKEVRIATPSKKKKLVAKEKIPRAESVDTNEKDIEKEEEWCPECTLNQILLRGLRAQSFKAPTAVQSRVLPAVLLKGRDIACAAETGSGKTLAFALPALEDALSIGTTLYTDVSEGDNKSLRTLIVAPTRELAMQVTEHARAILPEASTAAKATVITCLVGGLSDLKQTRILTKNQPPILVATPGRLWDLCESVPYLADALNPTKSALRFFVVDEVDKLLEVGAFPQLQNIAAKLQAENTKTRQGRWQTMVFSATLGLQPPATSLKTNQIPKTLSDFAEPLRSPRTRKLEVIDLTLTSGKSVKHTPISLESISPLIDNTTTSEKKDETPPLPKLPSKLQLQYIRVPTAAIKLGALVALLQKNEHKKILVFANAVKSVQRICLALELLQIKTANSLHSGMSQRSRLRALDRFRKPEQSATLIATDLAARGLDVPDLQLVIHYDLPNDPRIFVHRSGRVARAGRAGTAISLVSAMDLPDHKRILAAINGTISPLRLETRILDAASRRAGLALDIAKANAAQSRTQASTAWLKNLIKGEDNDFDDSMLHPPTLKEEEEEALLPISAHALHQKRTQLNTLLEEPLLSRPKRSFVVVDADTIAGLASSSHSCLKSASVSSTPSFGKRKDTTRTTTLSEKNFARQWKKEKKKKTTTQR